MQDPAEEDDEAASAAKEEVQALHISLLNNLTGMSMMMYNRRPSHSGCGRQGGIPQDIRLRILLMAPWRRKSKSQSRRFIPTLYFT